MILTTTRDIHGCLLLLGAAFLVAAAVPASAQLSRLPPGAVVQPSDDGAGAELRRNLTTLADNPRSLSALIGAGRAALATGDGEAALSFFARAEEIEPRDARVKAGMASALVLMEQAQTALSLFAEAQALGAPEAELARDRGLAYDMTGDPRRAQQDYALALRGGEDPEVRRRMALSLAISGQRAAALRMIDEQLRLQDRSAWRTQAFVLALTGDAAGANDTAARMMPAGAAQSMAPFFTRLAALSPSQKALAVHFGRFPSDGRTLAGSGADTAADPGAMAMARTGGPPAAMRTRPTAEVQSRQPRRRPDAGASAMDAARVGRRTEQGDTPIPMTRRPVESAAANSAPPIQPPRMVPPTLPQRQEPAPSQPPASLASPGISGRPAEVGLGSPAPGFSLAPQGEQPPPTAPATGFDRVAALVASLPPEVEERPLPTPAPQVRQTRPPATAANQRAARAESPPARARSTTPSHPARHWVQIAGGANRAGLPRELTRLRALAPALLGGRTAWTTPLNATNRLLVGPFESARAAQAFVNQLAERDVSAFAWTSPAGQEIDRLQTR